MKLPDFIVRELNERLDPVERPGYGKIKIDVELHYSEGQFLKATIAAYAVETVKA